jgi:NTP pyrophosphatase (non-canonical NTP hydrolase)
MENEVCSNQLQLTMLVGMETDPLGEIFSRQRTLARNFIPVDELFAGSLPSTERQKYLATYSQLLVEEAVEALRELPARKFWRPSVAEQPMDEEAWKEEMMDIIHIVVAMCIIGGMDSKEVFERYCKKNDINLERVKNNS